MTIVLPTSLKYCCYTTLWNAEVVVSLGHFAAMNYSYLVLRVAHAYAQKIIEKTKSLQMCYLLNINMSYQDLDRRRTETTPSSASGLLWVTRLLTALLESGVSVYVLAFVLEADILSTCWNKDGVMWHVRQWLFWETITVSHVCCYSVNHSNAPLITALPAHSDTSNFPR